MMNFNKIISEDEHDFYNLIWLLTRLLSSARKVVIKSLHLPDTRSHLYLSDMSSPSTVCTMFFNMQNHDIIIIFLLLIYLPQVAHHSVGVEGSSHMPLLLQL